MERFIISFLVLILFTSCIIISYEVITKGKQASEQIARQILNK